MKKVSRLARKKRNRKNIFGTPKRPRVSVYRSNKYIYAQLIDDSKGVTLALAKDTKLGKTKENKVSKIKRAEGVGEELSKKALAKKISQVVFNKSGYKYHGRVKALAEALRKGGLKF